jgi:hypothetical protein
MGWSSRLKNPALKTLGAWRPRPGGLAPAPRGPGARAPGAWRPRPGGLAAAPRAALKPSGAGAADGVRARRPSPRTAVPAHAGQQSVSLRAAPPSPLSPRTAHPPGGAALTRAEVVRSESRGGRAGPAGGTGRMPRHGSAQRPRPVAALAVARRARGGGTPRAAFKLSGAELRFGDRARRRPRSRPGPGTTPLNSGPRVAPAEFVVRDRAGGACARRRSRSGDRCSVSKALCLIGSSSGWIWIMILRP